MTVTCTDLTEQLQQDFRRVGGELAEARIRQVHKDTPANRAAVAACGARVDAILDLHLAISGPRT
jgi:hypothetical protein